jgi:hypothetical protein
LYLEALTGCKEALAAAHKKLYKEKPLKDIQEAAKMEVLGTQKTVAVEVIDKFLELDASTPIFPTAASTLTKQAIQSKLELSPPELPHSKSTLTLHHQQKRIPYLL